MKKEFCVENHKKIFRFFKQALSLTEKYFKKNAEMDMMHIDQVESNIIESFQAFVIKLSEDQLRP